MDKINHMNCNEFVDTFGSVIEHCELAAATIWAQRPFQNQQEIIDCFQHFLDSLSRDAQLGVLRLHPELGKRKLSQDKLTEDSKNEQKKGGLLELEDAEAQIMKELNKKYREMTGFPFVVCVAELDGRTSIELEMRRRLSLLAASKPILQDSLDDERIKGIDAVSKIAANRIKQIISNIE